MIGRLKTAAEVGLKPPKPIISPAAAEEQKNAKDPGFTALSQIQEISKAAMFDELNALLGPKLAAETRSITKQEAEGALKRLRKLEAGAPSAGEIGRGAGVGALVGPAASMAWRAIAGPKGWAGTGKLWPGTRPLLATAGHGAVFGGAMPAGRHFLEQEVEKQKLKEYLGQSRRGKLRSKIKKTTGL